MRSIKSSNALKIFGFSLAIGTGLAYYQVDKINKTLGVDILEYSLKSLREELEADNLAINGDNKAHFLIQEVSNEIIIVNKRLYVYFSRLLNMEKYEKTCKQINKNVILPLVSNYSQQKIFEYADIIEQFKEKNEFNNKLASLLIKVQQKNSEIKGQNKLLLERFYELQQQLLTAHIIDLNQQTKNQINTIYSYFKQRESFIAKLIYQKRKPEQLQNFINDNPTEAWIDELNYGFKIQYI